MAPSDSLGDTAADSGAADPPARPLGPALSEALERLLAEGKVRVQENGARLASLDGFRYEVRRSGEAPLLHLWSEERDLVRRVLRINEDESSRLKLQVSRLGHSRPDVLEFLVAEKGQNSKRVARERFCARFREFLLEKFPDEPPLSLTTAANLRYSLSGNYARGLLAAGSGAWAVLGAAPGESAATYDALLDFGLLWLDRARQSANRRRILGLRLFSPQGADRVTVNRLQALQSNTTVELYEYNPDTWRVRALDPRDTGNLDSSLVAHRDAEAALAQAAADIERVRRLSPHAIEAQAIPGTRDVALRFRGVLLARSRPQGLFFGLGEMQQPLTAENEEELVRLVAELERHRAPVPESARHPLYRAQPERWLQSMVMADPTRVDARLDPRFLYAQVPAFTAGDRGVLDLLGVTRAGRLAVLELKANEDLHLVWQGVDYWLRVRWHHQRQDFPRYGLPPQPVNATPPGINLFSKGGVHMTQRRWKLSSAQRAEMWSRWKAGQSLHAIGRALEKDHRVIRFLLARHGGIAPAARHRSPRVLTLAEREDISRGMASGCSMRVIAQRLSRSSSTVSREVARHGGRALYRANQADQQAWESGLRPKPCRLATHSKLQEIVAGKLMQDWSPQQISGWLRSQHPNDESLRVSHETIYRSLFIQARGVLKQELIQHLRSKRRIRRSRHASIHGHSQGKIVDALSIRERPAEVEDRAIPGHWEGDLLRGARNSHVATLVERHSRFCMLVKVSGKDTATVVAALSQHVRQLPATLRRSLTWDRGLEMAQHKSFTMATDVQVYFCDPQSPWQRGSNENTNGLLRHAEEGGSVLLLPVGPGRDRSASESTATKNVGI